MSTTVSGHPGRALALAAIVTFAVTAASVALTPFPLVLSDEANYLLATLHGYREENFARWAIVARIPSHAFYALYGALDGPHVHLHAKIVNSALIAAAAYPLYAIARTYVPAREAAAIAAAGVAMPVTSYARYFMPESLYFLGFCCALLAIVRTLGRPAWVTATVAGVLLALLSLVKPHALALAVAVSAFLLLRSSRWREGAAAAVLLAFVFWNLRIAFGYVLTGSIDLSLTGPGYAPVVAGGFAGPALLANLGGHIAALTLLAGIPVFVLACTLRRSGETREGPARELAVLSLCILIALVAMTAVFSASVYRLAPETERITRLHGRYYAFALPVVVIAYAAASRHRPAPRGATIAIWVGAAAAALWVLVARYETGFVDFADLSVVTRWPSGALTLATAVAACAAAALALGRPAKAVAFRAIPIVWWAALGLTSSLVLLSAPLVGKGFKPNDVDRAMSSDALRPLRGRDDVMVVGTQGDAPDVFRVMFHLASLSRGRIVASGTALGPRDIPADVGVLLMLPGVAFEGPAATARIGPLTRVQLRDVAP